MPRGRVDHGVLHGDLYLVGGGDPYMTERALVELRAGSARARPREDHRRRRHRQHLLRADHRRRADFDAQPFRSYNVLPDALMVNFQSSRFTVIANPQRARPQIVVNPLPANLVVKNQVRLGTGRCKRADGGIAFDMPDRTDPNTLVVSGMFPVVMRQSTR